MINFQKIVDLTHELNPTIPTWEKSSGFEAKMMLDYSDCTTDVKFRVQYFCMNAGIGTHIDSPAHIIQGAQTIDQLDLQKLIAPCVVINVADKATKDYSLSVEEVLDFEKKYGQISAGSFVIIHTGWSRLWSDANKYHNNHLFPSVSVPAAELLISRQIVGLGIDTLSPDSPGNNFLVHKALLGSGKYIVENIANADALPPIGSQIICLPLKVCQGTEAPVRLIALLP